MPPKAENYTFAQVKEIMEKNEDTMMKCFNAAMDRIEKKVHDLVNENIELKQDVKSFKQENDEL